MKGKNSFYLNYMSELKISHRKEPTVISALEMPCFLLIGELWLEVRTFGFPSHLYHFLAEIR